VRYFVLFAIDLKTRRVQIANICHQPYGQLLEQIARNWTDPVDGFLKNMRYLIHSITSSPSVSSTSETS
jgi:hypothetical protein